MLQKRIRSFSYAWKGVALAWREEENFRIELALGLLAVLAGLLFKISFTEWLVLVVVSGLVLTAEIFNTALEELCDMYRPMHDPHVGKIKDLSAGATLVASGTAFIVGLIIFVPHVWALV